MASDKFRSGWWWVPSLYFAEGLPYIVVMALAGIMYTRMDVSNAEMAFYTSWLMLPWLVKPLWSPIVDVISTKRRWVIAMQWLLALSLASVAFALPGAGWFRFSMASFFAIAFLSATHDIAADGYYMLGLDTEGQSFFVGIRTTFYRAAILFCQGPVVMVAGYLEESTGNITSAWTWTFYGLSALFLLFALYNSVAMPRVERTGNVTPGVREVVREFGESFASFFRKRHILAALAFMILYKLPEAQLDRFLMKITMDYPSLEEEVNILERHHTNAALVKLEDVTPVLTKEELLSLRALMSRVFVDRTLLQYIALIVQQTRTSKAVYLGASPRASVAMLQSSKAYALLQGRDFVTPEDIKFVAPYVLQHRLILTAEAEMEGYSPVKVTQRLIDKVEVPK